MKKREEILTKERIEYVRREREKHRSEAFEAAKFIIPADAMRELKELYTHYDEKSYVWLAGLYDPEAAAFYYSNSARDTEMYLPDVESTVQAYMFINRYGLVPAEREDLTARFKEHRTRTVDFVRNLQYPDGYFYHPQWKTDIPAPRKNRDYCWCKNFLTEMGAAPKYELPTSKPADGTRSKLLPPHLQDLEAFRAYLAEFDLSKRSYYIGNLLDTQVSQINAAGKEFADLVVFWLNEHQRTDNGLWQEEINYDSVNGLMKISGCYPGLGATLPNAYQGLKSAIFAAQSDERMKFVCEHYNPWVAMGNVFKGQKGLEKEKLDTLRNLLWENAASLIKKTKEKILVFKKEDGSFSYFKRMSASISQGACVSVPRSNEGDVNATSISHSTIKCMCVALGIPTIPFYSPADAELFFELLDNAPRIEKKFKNPGGDKFPERVPYEEEIAE